MPQASTQPKNTWPVIFGRLAFNHQNVHERSRKPRDWRLKGRKSPSKRVRTKMLTSFESQRFNLVIFAT